jgi:1,4-dihydroxy-2-naphthoate octaprenyltransferase
MAFAMWQKALTVIPRLEKPEWDGLDVVAKWLISTRAAVLIITVIPCVIAGLLAIRVGRFDPLLWLLVTVGLVMAHATNNLLNDLIDYRMGVDKNNYFRTQYGVQPIESGLMSMRQNLLYAAVTGLAALACGAYLVYVRGGPTIWLLSLGAFLVLFYTWPLKYIGLGEIAVLVVWGPLMIAGGYFVITGEWDWRVVVASLPYGLGATSVIFGKHIDKYEFDKVKHIRTLPVLLGESVSRYTVIAMMLAQYLFVAYLVITGYFSAALLLVLLAAGALVRALRVYSRPRPAARPQNYPAASWPLWFVAFSFVHNRVFGLWFLAGLGADVILHRIAA